MAELIKSPFKGGKEHVSRFYGKLKQFLIFTFGMKTIPRVS